MSLGLLLSGGMDSVSVAYWRKPTVAYTVNYGQIPAEGEIRAASALCQSLGIIHRVVEINCRSIGSGDLIGLQPLSIAPVSEWWPFRNQLIITLAAATAIQDMVTELMVGAVKSDSVHADGRPEFFQRMSELLKSQEGGLSVSAPAIHMSSDELVKASGIPFSLLAWSHSCHRSSFACGLCRGCVKHANTMKILGHADY